MMSLPLALVLVVGVLAAEWFYLRVFLRTVEPALIQRVERSLDVRIGFGFFHHWEVRDAGPDRSGAQRLALSAAIFGIHLGVMLVFAIGLVILALTIIAPVVWLHQR